jgi:hypothetical protein
MKIEIEKGTTINLGIGISFDNEEISIMFVKWYIIIKFKK